MKSCLVPSSTSEKPIIITTYSLSHGNIWHMFVLQTLDNFQFLVSIIIDAYLLHFKYSLLKLKVVLVAKENLIVLLDGKFIVAE